MSRYDAALDVDAYFPKALANKGVAMADSGDLLSALPYFDKALETTPNDYLTLFNKATVLSDLGFKLRQQNGKTKEADDVSKEALRIFQQVVTLRPTYTDAKVYKAISLHDLGQLDEAHETLLSVLQAHPDHENALYYQAKVALDRNDEDTARTAITRLLELDPANEYASALRSTLTLE
jgi:Flp pilus assembly protein TadD